MDLIDADEMMRVAVAAARKRFKSRTLSYKVDEIPDEIATAVVVALRDAGWTARTWAMEEGDDGD